MGARDDRPECRYPTDCDAETSVVDWVIDHPETWGTFESLGIDTSCAGKSLAWACEGRGLNAGDVLRRLIRVIDGTGHIGVLASIQVGQPRNLGVEGAADPMDRPWTTGFFKDAVAGPISLCPTGLKGDGQADMLHHGGPEKALLAYSAEHYPAWREALALADLPFGGFGENLTLTNLTEADVCIGDIWGIGDSAIVQVSQPRQPCWKLARRWRIKSLTADVQRTGRTGWYFRVLQPCTIAPGMPTVLRERPFPQWTVERANRVMHHDRHDLSAAAALAAVPALSASWRSTLNDRVNRMPHDDTPRIVGEND